MKKVRKTCPECKKEFETYLYRANTQIFCSKICRGQKTKKICEVCKKEYFVSRKYVTSKFCSSKCYGVWLSKNRIGQKHPKWKPKIKKICFTCKKEFFVCLSGKNKICCSRKCYNERRSKFFIGQKHPKWKPKIKKNCQFCKKSFEVIPALKHRKYCSFDCYYKWMSENTNGKHNNNWRGGNKKYGVEWTEQIRRKIRERDNYTCQVCGTHRTQLKDKLSVHHIDYDRTNTTFTNLILLCKKCHGMTNSNCEFWKNFFQNYLSERNKYLYPLSENPKTIKKETIIQQLNW